MADKQYNSIRFFESTHKYINVDTNDELMSITTFLHKFQKPFDSNKYSNLVAKRDGKTQKEVLSEWDEKCELACEFGTTLHEFFERMFLAPGRIIIPQNDEERLWLNAYNKTKQLEFLTGDVITEQIVYNNEYLLAGQSDLFHFPNKTHFDVGDYKTNENFRYFSPYNQYLLYPLTHLSDCEYNKYALQLSTYAYFYELMTGLKCRRLFIMYYWRSHNIFQVIPINYMKHEIMILLKHKKKNESNKH